MNDNLLNLVFILDRSGSMGSIWDDTIGGFKTYIKEQKEYAKEKGKDIKITYVAFDDKYDLLCDYKNIEDFNIDSYSVNPRGCTALLDAVGKTVNSVGEKLNKMQESEKPSKTIVVIMTDGCENASSEFSKEKIKEMIQLQENTYSWDFVYIGANQDSFEEAGSLGISSKNTMNYCANTRGVNTMYASLNSYTKSAVDNTTYDLSQDSQS